MSKSYSVYEDKLPIQIIRIRIIKDNFFNIHRQTYRTRIYLSERPKFSFLLEYISGISPNSNSVGLASASKVASKVIFYFKKKKSKQEKNIIAARLHKQTTLCLTLVDPAIKIKLPEKAKRKVEFLALLSIKTSMILN